MGVTAMNALLKPLQRLWRWSIFRFAVAGVINTALGYALYLIIYYASRDVWFAATGSVSIMLVISYLMGGHIVFNKVPKSRFIIYAISWLGLLWLNGTLVVKLTQMDISAELAPLILLPMNAVCSFIIQKFVVFRPTLTTSLRNNRED
ncbi:GtrA family protein [Ahrensia sp. R2A130]|uniref:GtrA family protein n=1 Tax=Ahrensia sp. R2A130 TaxID=744979 RepID=UPI00058B52CA|nr:GtrA family protein [Ahrensia sp. R2A130]